MTVKPSVSGFLRGAENSTDTGNDGREPRDPAEFEQPELREDAENEEGAEQWNTDAEDVGRREGVEQDRIRRKRLASGGERFERDGSRRQRRTDERGDEHERELRERKADDSAGDTGDDHHQISDEATFGEHGGNDVQTDVRANDERGDRGGERERDVRERGPEGPTDDDRDGECEQALRAERPEHLRGDDVSAASPDEKAEQGDGVHRQCGAEEHQHQSRQY